jgi:negative regulator of flagellin synthesis FlgM
MNIKTIPPYLTNAVQSTTVTTGKPGTEEKTAVGNASSSDRVQLSQDYQDMAQAQKAIAGSEDVRTEKVQQIVNQLNSGTYQINPNEIAGKMLDEIV